MQRDALEVAKAEVCWCACQHLGTKRVVRGINMIEQNFTLVGGIGVSFGRVI